MFHPILIAPTWDYTAWLDSVEIRGSEDYDNHNRTVLQGPSVDLLAEGIYQSVINVFWRPEDQHLVSLPDQVKLPTDIKEALVTPLIGVRM